VSSACVKLTPPRSRLVFHAKGIHTVSLLASANQAVFRASWRPHYLSPPLRGASFTKRDSRLSDLDIEALDRLAKPLHLAREDVRIDGDAQHLLRVATPYAQERERPAETGGARASRNAVDS
jgi:hypothetical protein